MDRKTTLIEFVKNEVMRNKNARLSESEDLLSAGILDSLAILQLVAFIEEQFGIKVPDEDVVFENFQSINTLTSYLENYR
jgi:methoxymalonate biosynthesis acyl carrier protein